MIVPCAPVQGYVGVRRMRIPEKSEIMSALPRKFSCTGAFELGLITDSNFADL